MNVTEAIQQLDFSILNFIQNTFACDFMNTLMILITNLGAGVIWIIGAIVLLFFKKYRFFGIAVLAALLFTILLSEYGLKLLVMRERPYLLVEGFQLIIKEPSGTSFPSSHTATSFAAAMPFFMVKKRFGLIALFYAVLVGFSRLYLYVHFPSDVLCGAIFGSLIGIGMAFLFRYISKRFWDSRKPSAHTDTTE